MESNASSQGTPRKGHSTITTTLDIYAHVTPGMQKEAALRFDEALQLRAASQVIG